MVFPDEVLFLRQHLAHPNVLCTDPAMNFRMRDEPLLDPKHIERFHPVGPAAHCLSLLDQMPEQRISIARRHGKLIGMFTRE